MTTNFFKHGAIFFSTGKNKPDNGVAYANVRVGKSSRSQIKIYHLDDDRMCLSDNGRLQDLFKEYSVTIDGVVEIVNRLKSTGDYRFDGREFVIDVVAIGMSEGKRSKLLECSIKSFAKLLCECRAVLANRQIKEKTKRLKIVRSA